MLSLTAVIFGATAFAAPQLLGLGPADVSKFTYYTMPTILSGPCDLTTGPDGAIWASDILTDKVARINITTGEVSEYDIPYDKTPEFAIPPEILGRGALACVIQPGEDGMLYAASGLRNQLVRINPTTKEIKVFTPNPPSPLGNLIPLNDLWRGPTGMYFTQTTGNVISHFDYKTEKFTDYPVPTALGIPVGIFVASDGGVYFCEFLGQKIGRLNATDGTFKEYQVPLSLLTPTVMRAETEGRYVWFTAFVGNANGRLDIFTGEFKAFPNPSILSFPTENTVDGEGNIWFSTATQNTLNKLIPSTGEVQTFKQPGTLIVAPISVPPALNIAMHYGPDNAMWFTEVLNNRIGRYQL